MIGHWRWAAGWLALSAFGCSSSGASDANAGSPGAIDDAQLFHSARLLEVPVPETGRSYVSLSEARVVTPTGDVTNSSAWDLAFEGYDVFSNGGVSGAGKGGAFGQLDIGAFLDDSAPEVPFISADKTGGAFLDWYAYDSGSHALYSRFHVYGVQRGARLWKVQILRYYGEQDHAAVSALYSLRYAELSSPTPSTQTVEVDGTAGGLGASANSASGCIDLATGSVLSLTAIEAEASSDWDLCFRRDAVSLNGQASGPRGDAALDLQASETSSEELTTIVTETADSQLPRFDQATAADFEGGRFRGDHIVSGFETGRWLDETSTPPSPTRAAWLVNDASGARQFLVAFSAFNEATVASPGTVVMHIQSVVK
ncbi:MAG: HmuY family protein [Polyangiaceae bacterium]